MMSQTISDTKVITTAVELACCAPSLHNSQPCQWIASSASVDLFVDPHRTVTPTDKSAREAVISCGAALDHFPVAMAAVGWDTNVEQFPNPNNLDHLASIDFASVDDDVAQARRDPR